MRQYKGTATGVTTPVLGVVTRRLLALSRAASVLVAPEATIASKGFAGLVVEKSRGRKGAVPQVIVPREMSDKLKDGDCVILDREGAISVVWDRDAPENSLMVTEACDCRCVMCPQPPKADDGVLMDICKRILRLATSKKGQTICLTGGEPTLRKDEFCELLRMIGKMHPTASVMLLTNGKSFADFDFAKRFVSVRPREFLTCVSLHSDVDELHDQIVGVRGSFYKTVMGLQNLARFRERIEIRVVVSRMNANRLESIATFIQRNLPFVVHCAFMGLEVTGYARDNYEAVWIDPYECRTELSRAVRVLSRADMNVSIYNVPLCLLEPQSWNFARQSISKWKNDYLPNCGGCCVKARCCGVFTTSGSYQSAHIRPQG